MAHEVPRRILSRAVSRFGLGELAKRLKVPAHLLEAWMTGHASMPRDKLLALADVIVKLDGKKK
jgi:hypothetical protein